MAVEAFHPDSDTVRVTPAAVRHFQEQMAADTSALGVRLSVRESGCTGYMYVVDLLNDPAQGGNDLQLKLAEGLTLFIDRTNLGILTGTEIDYVREGINRQLAFRNPNAQDYCGCGESFSVESA